jgi:DNA polymerase-1
MANKKEKFIIIDGNALIHRSFHALPPLTTKSGQMVNAVYGFTSVLLKAIKEFKPAFIALTFDRKEKTFRHEDYKEYKATRIKAPDELYEQIPLAKEVAAAMNIPIYEKAGFEADDLIGTLSKKVGSDIEKIIVTGDMDTLQLINDSTKVYAMSRGLSDSVTYDEQAVMARFGLKPEQMIDYKALRGDPSDNIPGVKGIGEKTAIELLQEFKTLDGVYEYVGQIKNLKSKVEKDKKIKERILSLLDDHKEEAYMSRNLAEIKCDVEIAFSLADLRFSGFDRENAAALFSKFEFKSLLPRLQSITNYEGNTDIQEGGESLDKFKRNKKLFKYILIDNNKEFEKFINKLIKQSAFTFDTETVNFEPVCAQLLGVSFSWIEGEAYYVQMKNEKLSSRAKTSASKKVQSNDLFNYKNIHLKNERPEWLDELTPIFENEKIKKYGHNIKYDIEVMASYDVEVKGVEADSMIMSYLLNPGSRQHNLDTVTFSELSFQKISKDDLLGKGKEKKTFGEVDLEKLYNYSCEDADFTNRLVKKLFPQLKKANLEKLFYEMEMPLVQVLANMEMNGILIDGKYLLKIKTRVDKEISGLTEKIFKLSGTEFNINSTQQLREILFEKLTLPIFGITKTKTGFSTGADELEKLKDQHPIIRLIQKYRELTKLMNTYIDALPQLINKKTGRLHTSFNQSVTATGRLSSTEPNLQNIPIKSDLGKEIRQAFIADKGHKLLSLDYSQIELRLAAHMSGDKKMIKAFLNGEDIHRATAAAINEVEPAQVTDKMRREAKAINFGIIYGQGPHGLSQNADIPYARAKDFIDNYFLVYKDIKKYIEQTIDEARAKGYTETLFGRKRYLPEINSSVAMVRKSAERIAVNTPLQGTAADIIKTAMVKIYKDIYFKYNKDEVRLLLTVHDELLFEVKNNLVDECAEKFKVTMENAIKLNVPIIVDAKVGDNWGEMIKVESEKLKVKS